MPGIQIIALSLTLLISNIYAGKIKLKNGTYVEVPNAVTIHNDLDDDVFIEERSVKVTPKNEVDVEVNKKISAQTTTQLLGILINGRKYNVKYPTYFHPEADSHPLEIYTVFKYKASDIVNGACDIQGLTVRS